MSEIVQIIRLRTDDFDTLNKLNEQYRADTAGRSTYTQPGRRSRPRHRRLRRRRDLPI